MAQLPPIVSTLIERFEHNRDSYKSQGYNETQLRREFLDPFFEALGWDVANRQGHAEAYKHKHLAGHLFPDWAGGFAT